MKKVSSLMVLCYFLFAFIKAQDSLSVKNNNKLNTQSILLVNTENNKQDSTQFKTPKYKQGFFCNFEDQLNRKKVPIDFSLGNSKY